MNDEKLTKENLSFALCIITKTDEEDKGNFQFPYFISNLWR